MAERRPSFWINLFRVWNESKVLIASAYKMAPNKNDDQILTKVETENHALNIDQNDKSEYQSKGYLWQKGFFSSYQTRIFQKWSDEIYEKGQNLLKAEKAGVVTDSKMIAIRDKARTDLVCRTENMSNCMENIKGLIQGILIPYLEQLTGEKWILLKDKLFFRWPDKKSKLGGAKDGVPVHQDILCFDFDQEYGPSDVITVIVPIDPFTQDNGCTNFALNWKALAQKTENGQFILPSVPSGPLKGTVPKKLSDEMRFEPILAEPGDILLFDAYIPHGSGDNISDRPRRCLVFSFNRLDDGNFNKALYERKWQKSSCSLVNDFPSID